MMCKPLLVLLTTWVYLVEGSFYLKPLSYTKLPATVSATTGAETFKLFAGTAEEGAYDPIKKMLYVVGMQVLQIFASISLLNCGN